TSNMIILIKTSTITFSLDINPSDRVSVLMIKVAERATLEPYQFQLSFAGDVMSDPDAPISAFGIKKEGTVHLTVIKQLVYSVEFKGTVYEATIANNPGLTIHSLRVYVYSEEELPLVSNDEVLQHFIETSVSNDVEVVFCFDTTGSMSGVIKEVREKVRETVSRLIKEIPSIRIGIIGLGDYCDTLNAYNQLDLTSNVDKLCKFITSVPSTSGGDEPEAYEYALYRAKSMSWSKHTSKALVMIGDSPPHTPYYTNLNLNWIQETDDLEALGIKIYGVVCCHDRYKSFYSAMAERTNGLCIKFDRFNLISDMFMAICFRESNKAKYEEFRSETAKNNSSDAGMQQMFSDLDKENYKLAPMYEESVKEKENEKESAADKLEVGGEKTDAVVAAKPQAIRKRYGVISDSPGMPDFISFTNMSDETLKNTKILYRSVGRLFISSGHRNSKYRNPVIAMVIGSIHIGFAQMSKQLVLEHIHKKGKVIFHDYRQDRFVKPPVKNIIVAAFAFDSVESFEQLSDKIKEVKALLPKTPVVLMGLKSDLKDLDTENMGLIGRMRSRTRSKSMSVLPTTTASTTDGASTTTTAVAVAAPAVIVPKRSIVKNNIDMLMADYSLDGYIECSSNNKSSLLMAEKKVYEIYKKY
ncbi:hypothetical protein SAMD00019534_036800, partial [Acytostelium subglobosum LB1]|uniref:hypothetical protein n=1 Tax=Acytostelium subglobosum LB1 TaxID=1410327 RepID=UPI000645188C